MSCFFCKSFFHSSQKCDIYPSIESRKAFLIQNPICENCLSSIPFQSYKYGKKLCVTCVQYGRQLNPKCYTCFSKDHRSLSCQQKNYFESFMPRIDQNLHSRFFQTLDPIDKYSVAFSYPKYLHLLKQPKGIKVATYMEQYHIKSQTNRDTLIASGLCFESEFPQYLSNLLATNGVSISSKVLVLENIQNVPVKHFFRLIFSHTTSIRLQNVQFDSQVKFSKILSKIPNIEEIDLKDTNIEIENSWPDNLLKFDAGRNLKYLGIQLDNCDFDFGKLAKFMKTKTSLSIHLQIIPTENAPNDFSSILEEKIDPHFVLGHPYNSVLLSISYPKYAITRNIQLSLA